MTTKLVQKQFLKGLREFELLNDVVSVRIKTPIKEEKITVGLTTLDPEPVVNKPYLEFHSREANGPTVCLLLDKPTAEEFRSFVESLKRRVLAGYTASADSDAAPQPTELAANSYEEPPQFDESEQRRLNHIRRNVNAVRLDEAIGLLKMYTVAEEVKPFLSALEALKNESENEAHVAQVLKTFEDLGITQGAVLTYAPYIGILLSGNPYGDD